MSWTSDFMRLVCVSVMLVGVITESVKPSPPTLQIKKKDNDLSFSASPPISDSPQCWKYLFQYRKCNENPQFLNVTQKDNWEAIVEYDDACKYTVQVKAIYDTTNCGQDKLDSDMSSPVYFGQDSNPSLLFIVVMIVVPVIMCLGLIFAIILFRRHREKFLPKIPNPSHYFKDMYDYKKGITQGLYTKELYVPNEEVMDEVHVEPNTSHLHNDF